ncbi:hypothetical protein [Paenibacillus sp. PL2-23]|uniref:hypothetical protein n=1 Tax=Paenibacillus sp. PL2-23 TaxID=2100729 RepID=UPI0030F8A6F3
MPNVIPYLVLTLISVLLLAAMMLHQRNARLVVLLLTFSGMVYVAEFFVLVVWNGYEYLPHVLSTRYQDNLVGAIVSNLWIIPVLGVLVALYRLGFFWMLAFALALAGVEWLFTWLGVYEPYWWKRTYTVGAVLFFFGLVRFWYSRLRQGQPVVRFVSLWMQAWSAVATVMFLMSVLQVRYYQIGVYEDPERDNIFLSSIMGLLKAGVFSALVAGIPDRRKQWRLLAPLIMLAVDAPLYYAGWLLIHSPLWLYACVYLLCALALLGWNTLAYRYIWKLGESYKG